MKVASVFRIAAVAVALAASSAAHAMYRCGNVFQDTPCDAAGVPMRPGGVQPSPAATRNPAATPAPPAAASPFAATCSRIGEEAQKMVWKREGGATQERQMAELPGGNREEMAKVLESVYRKRGSAPQVRAAIEAECLAEKQQAADNAAILRALLPANGASAGSPGAPATAPTPASAASAGPKPQAAASPNPACTGWRRDLDGLNAQLRGGGNAGVMERLQAQRRALEKNMSDGRC